MACFSVDYFFQLMIWCVIVGAIYGIIKLVLPAVMAQLGGPGSILAGAINIALWAVLIIAVLYIIWGLVNCLLGGGGLHMPIPRR